MKFISLFTGVGGFDLGFERAGMECVAQVEKDKFARQVLDYRYRGVPKFEDVKHVGRHNLPAADVLCGGFPCQDVSQAGNRKGLAGKRSSLWFEFRRIAEETRTEWVVIENVPGLLSSNEGADFATVLRGLVELGYRVLWRVLDSQYFGVPQRRRRVFIIGHLGSGRAAQVLLEQNGMSRNPEPRTAAGERYAAIAYDGASITSRENRANPMPELCHTLHGRTRESIVVTQPSTYRMRGYGDYEPDTVASTVKSRDWKDSTDLIAEAIDVRNLRSNGQVSGTLQAKPSGGYSLNYTNPIAFLSNASAKAGLSIGTYSPTLTNQGQGTQSISVLADHAVRRLTPRECERLQGFPDDWTAMCSDSQRYKQMGNAVTVAVAEWIGKRMMAVRS